MKCAISWIFVGCILLTHLAFAKEYYFVNIVAPENIRSVLKQHLEIKQRQSQEDISPEQFQHLLDSTPVEVSDLLATQGYFSPHVSIKLENDAGKPAVIIQVEPGAETTVRSYDIAIKGIVTQDTTLPIYRKAIRRTWSLRQREVFTQPKWELAKRSGVLALSREKYARAKIVHSEAKIIPEERHADLKVTYDSGPVYTIGDVSIHGLKKYPEEMVRQQIHLRHGESYSQDKLFDLQSTLQNFPHFSSAIVEVDFRQEKIIDTDHVEAPVVVTVQEAPLHKLRAGLGYSKERGVREEMHYQYNNMANRGWVLALNAKLDRLEKFGIVSLTVPKRSSGYEDSFYGQYKRSNIQQLFSEEKTIAAQRTRKKGLIEMGLWLDYTAERRQFDDNSWESLRALVLNYKWIRRDLDSIVNPRHGNMVWVEAGGAAKNVGSDTTFMRFHGTGLIYWKLGRKDIVISRLEIGQVFAGQEIAIPSKWLFRAGGSNSIRGYDYQNFGVPRRGSIVGGRVVGTGTVEYQHTVYKDWRGAIFVDAGDAAKNWQEYKLHTGSGIGARWVSSVGMFGADLAYGFQEKKWRFYISMGLTF